MGASSGGALDNESLKMQLSQIQRATLLIHELTGLKPLHASIIVSKNNVDAIFVHGTLQVLVHMS
jgi:hypothetical protein